MDIGKVRGTIMAEVALLPGSRDRLGACLLHFPSQPDYKIYPMEEIVALLAYYSQIPDERSKKAGFTVVVDMRTGWVRHLKMVLKAVRQVLCKHIAVVLVIRPASWMDKQRMAVDVMLDAYEFDVQMITVHKLTKHIDHGQLPPSLGGTFDVDVRQWCTLRERYEEMLLEGAKLMRSVTREPPSDSPASTSAVDLFARRANALSDDLMTGRSDNRDHRTAAQRVDTLCKQIQSMAARPDKNSKQSQADAQIYKQFSLGVTNVLHWLRGAGEKWLLVVHEVGESEAEARQLLDEHRKLANKANDILGQVDELNSGAARLYDVDNSHFVDVTQARDEVQRVSQHFLQRVNRQRGVCERSVELHSAHDAYAECVTKLEDLLHSNIECADVATCEVGLHNLNSAMNEAEARSSQLNKLGVDLLATLNVVEFNSHGHELVRDYVAGIVHVRQMLTDMACRQSRSSQLVDVRRLKVQQLLQLYTCETDCCQAIDWLRELNATLNADYADVLEPDIAQLKADLSKLEQTARSTYDYGQQLTQVSLVLRRSLRIKVAPQIDLARRLEEAWTHFTRDLIECTARLSISRAFHAAATEVDGRLESLCHDIERKTGVGRAMSPITDGNLPNVDISMSSPLQLTQLDDMLNTCSPPPSKPSPPSSSPQSNADDAARRLDDDVRELRYMASVLSTDTNNTNHIRGLMEEIEGKQKHLDQLIKHHSTKESCAPSD